MDVEDAAGNRGEGRALDGVKDTPVTMGTWTIHFGLDNGMWASHEGICEAIRDLNLDVVGRLESDTHRITMGNHDLTQYPSETLHMYTDLSHAHLGLDFACPIQATLDVHGTPVDVVVTHNGQEPDWEDRRLQTTTLADILAGNEGLPSVFLGYVISHPGVEKELYRMIVDKANMRDTDTDTNEEDRCCQGLKRSGFTSVSRGHLTDSEIQAGKYIVAKRIQRQIRD
ncbi:hypothetical protein BJ742DRAFT_779070 [Cladochytrium replicatum]|nr:hypothetical protein BJ742DRAFT_779070 [Cladochytrium replicatum]